MREWFKKYLSWLGFGTLMFGALIVMVDELILKTMSIIHNDLFLFGFLNIMIGAQTIQDILNDKYFKKYSEKVKNGIIVFIVTITIGMSYFFIF